MTHRDVFPWISVRSELRGDAMHRKLLASRPESLGKTPVRLSSRTFGGRRMTLPMRCIAFRLSPARRFLKTISMGYY